MTRSIFDERVVSGARRGAGVVEHRRDRRGARREKV
jgi:hypothetical protein